MTWPTTEEFADMLYAAGWRDRGDAQWENLAQVLAQLRDRVENGNITRSLGTSPEQTQYSQKS